MIQLHVQRHRQNWRGKLLSKQLSPKQNQNLQQTYFSISKRLCLHKNQSIFHCLLSPKQSAAHPHIGIKDRHHNLLTTSPQMNKSTSKKLSRRGHKANARKLERRMKTCPISTLSRSHKRRPPRSECRAVRVDATSEKRSKIIRTKRRVPCLFLHYFRISFIKASQASRISTLSPSS
jgi:hypothetical protein